MKIIANISRVLVGLLFIFSGWIKANDPLGFSYKLEEYYHVFGLDFLTSTAVYQAMFICVLEIVLGFALLLGTRMKITGTLLLLMIVFFTLLTGYTAVSNWFFENHESGTTKWFANLFGFSPRSLYYMTDCGCFGEFIKLTPMQSFFKDLVLLVLIVVIFIRRKHIRSIFPRAMQTNILVTLSVVFTAFTVYCFMYLPPVNFLNWKNGNDVAPLITCPPDAPRDSFDMVFIYEINGKPTEFTPNNLNQLPPNPKFIERKQKLIREGCRPKIMGFNMFNKTVQENNDPVDFKDSMLLNNDFQLLVISYDLHHARKNGMKKIATLTKEFIEVDHKKVWGLAGTAYDEIEPIRHEYALIFDFYNVDPKMLKSMIRSNAGLILMKGSVVIDSWPSTNIPSIKKVRKAMEKYTAKEKK